MTMHGIPVHRDRACAFYLLLVVLWTVSVAPASQAQERDADPYRFFRWTLEDARALGPAITSQRVAYGALGGSVVLVALSPFDEPAVDQAIAWSESTPRPAYRVLNELGNVRGVRPAALMLFLGSLTSDSPRFQDAAFTSLQAIVFSNVMTDVLKSIAGRSRPYEGEGALHFRPFSGDLSFPSGHATTVFAFTTPWLMYYPGVPTYGLMALSAGTAYARLADNVHWFTDVVAGSAIGFSTAYWLSRRHQRAAERLRIEPVIAADRVGLRVHLPR
jgi:hypothetical protein